MLKFKTQCETISESLAKKAAGLKDALEDAKVRQNQSEGGMGTSAAIPTVAFTMMRMSLKKRKGKDGKK